MEERLQSAFGLVALTALAWALGENRRHASLRLTLVGLALQIGLAAVLLGLPPVQGIFAALNRAVGALQAATEAGTGLVFGYLGGGPAPFAVTDPSAGFVLGFRALPLILVISALTALLSYWRILPLIVRGLSLALERILGVGGAVGLSTAANVFVGMVEAPLFIRPYLRELTRSELFMVMTAGMASIAGTVMVLYATILGPVLPDAAGHLLTASLISAPAAITIARLMIPETDTATAGRLMPVPDAASTMDAITKGTQEGLALLLNVAAMLVVLVALVHLANAILALLPFAVTLQGALGSLMAPIAWLMGIPWAEAVTAGGLLGVKTILNELIAYVQLAALPPEALSPRSRLIMTYALCGFANLGSLGIMIGGLATMIPERRAEIAGLGLRSLVSGTLATCLTGAVVGLF